MPRVPFLLLAVWLTGMVAMATPRRVGDASEYVAMALNLSRLRPPALSAADFAEIDAAFARHPGEFELATRRLPELQGTDGRQDMPHMWVYPLLAVPFVFAATAIGAPPAWGFVALNTVLLAVLGMLAIWRGARTWGLIVFASPVVWWLDKPLADLLMAACLGVAVLLWPRHGALALVVLGVASAQNPGVLPVLALFLVWAVVTDPSRVRQPRWWLAGIGAATLAAVAPLYYLRHLGRLSPLTTYAVAHWPTLPALLFPLTDVNMGALLRFTPGAVALMVAAARREGWRDPASVPAALSMAVLLGVVSQQPNQNQGGNADFSRYALWLLPLGLPWLLAADRSTRAAMRGTGVVLLAAACAWSLFLFRPSRPESYRYPTPLATLLWTRYPSWTHPTPEAFAERLSHREPGWVPVATAGCEKVLLHEGHWPAACLPRGDMAEVCATRGRFCYANRGRDGAYTFADAGTTPRIELVVHDRTWRHGDPAAAQLASLVRDLRPVSDNAAWASVRSTSDAAWVQAWANDSRMVLYVRDAGAGARMALRTSRAVRATIRAGSGERVQTRRLAPTGAAPVTLDLPASRDVIVTLEVTSTSNTRSGP